MNDDKLKSVNYFLYEILDKSYPIEERKDEMLRRASKLCNGLPKWSDLFGTELKSIDYINKEELKYLLKYINE